jgi:hypothetical protein
MHSGSGTGSNIKCNTKVKKEKKLDANFLVNNAASNIEKERFFTNFLLVKNCAE